MLSLCYVEFLSDFMLLRALNIETPLSQMALVIKKILQTGTFGFFLAGIVFGRCVGCP
jgi:hypothetical protein